MGTHERGLVGAPERGRSENDYDETHEKKNSKKSAQKGRIRVQLRSAQSGQV